jgi:hypothetical protein
MRGLFHSRIYEIEQHIKSAEGKEGKEDYVKELKIRLAEVKCLDAEDRRWNGKRFSYHTVGYGVYSLLGEKYRMGRVEIFDTEDESGYASDEGSYCLPHAAAAKFEDFIESLRTDLPICIEMGSVEQCQNETGKALGIDADKLHDAETKKAYWAVKNEIFAKEQGYESWADLLVKSKFGPNNPANK